MEAFTFQGCKILNTKDEFLSFVGEWGFSACKTGENREDGTVSYNNQGLYWYEFGSREDAAKFIYDGDESVPYAVQEAIDSDDDEKAYDLCKEGEANSKVEVGDVVIYFLPNLRSIGLICAIDGENIVVSNHIDYYDVVTRDDVERLKPNTYYVCKASKSLEWVADIETCEIKAFALADNLSEEFPHLEISIYTDDITLKSELTHIQAQRYYEAKAQAS